MACVSPECLAKDPWFIVVAYTLAFLPWTILSSYDFISAKWRTVKSTRRSGWLHLAFSSIPLAYILFYAFIQGLAAEYSEMCAAIFASFFAAWNTIRTTWGLWQLHIFKKWVKNSVKYLHAAGVDCRLRRTGAWTEKNRDSSYDTDPSIIADGILVNEKLIDNQVSHGEVLCVLKYKDKAILNWSLVNSDMDLDEINLSSVSNFFMQLIFSFFALFFIIKDFVCAKILMNYKMKVHMEPVKPVDVSINWMATFVMQLLDHMVADIVTSNRVVGSAESGSGERGDLFCSELVASAIIQLQYASEGSSHRNMFLWKDASEWYHSSYGKFSRAELFDKAISNKEILPFKTSQKENLLNAKLVNIETVGILKQFEHETKSSEADTESFSKAITPEGFIETVKSRAVAGVERSYELTVDKHTKLNG